ncbi:MAG: S-adenosylmethionine synthetase N-terminal domain-containing protein [Sulfuricella sp.]
MSEHPAVSWSEAGEARSARWRSESGVPPPKRVVIAGEFKTAHKPLFNDIRNRAEEIARQMLHDIGYRDAETGIDPDRCEVQVRFNHQSIQINKGIALDGGGHRCWRPGADVRLCV